MIAFINEFLSYLLLFIIFVVSMLVAVKIGTTLRKRKNAAEAVPAEAESKNS